MTATPAPPTFDLLLLGGWVLPMTPAAPPIAGGAVGVIGDRVAFVGPAADLPPGTSARRREAVAGGVICPGFINLHAHLAHSLLTAAGDGLSVSDWLEHLIFPLERRAVDEAFVAVASEVGVAQMLAAGVTCTVDMYYFEDAVARVVDRVGYRAVLGETVIGYPAPDAPAPGGGLRHAERLLRDWAGHGRITPAVAPHAAYTTSKELLTQALALQQRLGGPYLIHLSEARSEIATIAERHGASPIAYLEGLGILEAPVIGAHVIYPQPGDLEILARRRVAVAHCPQSNLHMGEAAAPIADYLEAGVPVGLGTDGAGSAPAVDLVADAALCGRLMKMRAGRADAVTARTLLSLLTTGAAAALRRDDLGALAPGRQADLVVLAPAGPAPAGPATDPYSLVVYAAAHRQVALTVVAGRVLYDRGGYPTIDLGRLQAAAAGQAERMRRALEGPRSPD